MSKNYEVAIILTPVLSDDQTKEAINGYKKVLKDLNAKIVHEEAWGLKKLAYSINKKNTGYYHLFQLEAPGTSIADLETTFRRDERVMRFLTIRLDKYAMEWADKRKAKIAAGKSGKKDKKEELAA